MRIASPRLGFAAVAAYVLTACSTGSDDPSSDAAPDGDGSGSSVDATAPVLEDVEFSTAGFEELVVRWRTDEPSTSRLELGVLADGEEPVLDEVVEVSAVLVLDHEVVVDALPAGAYAVRLVCTDAAGNEGSSAVLTAEVPDRRPPVLKDVEVDFPSEATARFRFGTDEPAVARIEWGPTDDLGSVELGPGPLRDHVLDLWPITPGAVYRYSIVCEDLVGNVSESSLAQFLLADDVPPVVLDINVEPLSPDAARVAWTTDEPASGLLSWGTTTALGQEVERPAAATAHSVVLNGLAGAGTLHASLRSTDASGNVTVTPAQSFDLVDSTPPLVDGVQATVLGPDSARVTWTTDEPATARVEYGTSPSYEASTTETAILTTTHSVLLSGLDEGATYHFRAVSEDAGGNAAASADATFATPDPFPPTVFGVSALEVAPGTVAVIWGTDEPASSFVLWGGSAALGQVAGTGNPLVTTHVVLLTGLGTLPKVHLQPVSLDAAGNPGVGPLTQVSLAVDDEPPVVSGVALGQLSQSEASVAWTTDEPAVYVLEYGPGPSYGSWVSQSTVLETQHSAVLSGLDVGTYHFRITCADAAGNLGVGHEGTLEVADVTPPTVTQVSVDPSEDAALLTWQTDEPAVSALQTGTTPSYGIHLPVSQAPTTQHALLLEDLQPETTYHFSAVCIDEAGNAVVTPDQTFETDPASPVEISGKLVAWHPVTLTVPGPYASENDLSPNPFRDYRFTVRFESPSGAEWIVPGFFDADGEGGSEGDLWRAHLAPEEGGTWTYELLFQEGPDLAVDLDLGAGAPLGPHGLTGEFEIAPRDPSAPGFLSEGLLEYVGGHYLKFRDGSYFLKNGVNGPENLLAFEGFDNTNDQPGGLSTSGLPNGLHRFLNHVGDFGSAGLGDGEDPFFTSADTGANSRGLVGALNYLESVGINSVYFLPMNLGGDGRDTYPFVSPVDNTSSKTRYDVSKLDQWNRVFEHATRHGIQLHFVLAETESGNETWLGTSFGATRKLFFRELVARFAHNLAIKWNLSEESDFSKSEHLAFAEYLRSLDPYDHPIGFHTHMFSSGGWYGDYEEVLGETALSMTAIQAFPDDVGNHVETWRKRSSDAGHPWVVEIDEIGPAGTGLTNANESDRRRRCLWDILMSGGAVEWYFGYHSLPLGGDVRLEDFRTREEMWSYNRIAHDFVASLPFWKMEPRDELVSGESGAFGGAEVFAERAAVYAVYLPNASSTGSIDLNETSGDFVRRWFNPRSGTWGGPGVTVEAGQVLPNGAPPNSPDKDWIVLYERP